MSVKWQCTCVLQINHRATKVDTIGAHAYGGTGYGGWLALISCGFEG